MVISRVNLPALLVAFIGGLVALHDAQGLVASLAGLTLLTALVAYDEEAERSAWQSLAFAFVCGLAALCTVSYPVRAALGESGLAILPVFLANEFSAVIWLGATAVVWFVDRARMNSRQPVSLSGRSTTVMSPFAPQLVRESRTFPPAASPVVTTAPASELDTSAPEPPPAESANTNFPSTTPTHAPPAPVPSGKEVTIYVNMMGEGMNVLRAVRAEHLGRDFYIIVDEMPADETWEYVPGQVVRCRKKNLSSGKGLVAYEEAPRAQ